MANKNELGPLLRMAEAEGWREWIVDERDEAAVLEGCRFDENAAKRVFEFFEKFLCHSKGQWAGKPFNLLEWQQKKLIGPVFGWKRADGTRRFRRVHAEVPKKNGKSTVAAGVGLYMLVADGESGAECYSAATAKHQAAIVHDEAVHMVKSSPGLRKLLTINHTTKTITFSRTFSKYKALASEHAGSEGLNIYCLIADELHVWKGRAFWDSLRYGFAARSQPLHFTITTAGIYDPSSLGWQEHEYALDVLEGRKHDPELYVVVFAAPTDCDYLDPAMHEVANPSYPEIIKPSEIMQAARVAKEKRSELGPFLRYRLNIWSHEAESFFDMARWGECADEYDEAALRGKRCFGGLDLSVKHDLTAWALLFPPQAGIEKWTILVRLFCPKDTAEERESRDGVLYATWGREGYIELTPGNVIDYKYLKTRMLDDRKKFNIVEVGADPYQLEALRQQILDECPDMEVIEVGQTVKNLSEPTKELEVLVLSQRIRHNKNPCLNWQMGNCVAEPDGKGNLYLHKKKSRGKIDAVSAIINALARAMVNEGPKRSVYNDRGMISL